MIKKVALSVLAVILVVIAAFVLVNFFDESPRPGLYTEKDLRPATFDKSNGFYILWGLAESPDVDVQSDAYTKKIRRYFESGPNREAFARNFDTKKYKEHFRKIIGSVRLEKCPQLFNKSWITAMEMHPENLAKARVAGAGLLKRYDDLMAAAVFEDFTSPYYYAPIPNLLAWIQTGRLYTAVHAADAPNGNWDASARALLKQLDLTKKVIANSRPLITNLVAKAVMNMSLQGLASIMNHPDCPDSVFPIVLAGMPDLRYEDYGNRHSFISECLSSYSMVDGFKYEDFSEYPDGFSPGFKLPLTPFLNKNRTKNYFYDFYSSLIHLEQQEPHMWKRSLKEIETEFTKTRSSLWWFRNPVGKVIFRIAAPNIAVSIAKSYRNRAYYEMVRILAEFRMNDSPGKPVQEILNGLTSYQSLDPCSGKPYSWNDEKKILYSFGVDSKDNNGEENIGVLDGTDFVVHFVMQ